MQKTLIWDGRNFRHVAGEEADQLVNEDKAQNLSVRPRPKLKFRREFTGYLTRELRADTPATPAADWKDHKKAAADFLGKPYPKVTKADTLEYMEKHLGLAAA